MSKLFRFLESLGKSNGKKWSHIGKLFLMKGVKSPRQNKFFTDVFLHLFTPFKRLFAPTSWSPMSKLFRFSKSLGKTNVKKWSQIWKLLLIKVVKSPRKKKFFFLANFALLAGFFWYRCYYPHRSRDSLSPVCGIFQEYIAFKAISVDQGKIDIFQR